MPRASWDAGYFDSRKYGRIRDWLVRQGLRKPRDFVVPRPCTHAEHSIEGILTRFDRQT